MTQQTNAPAEPLDLDTLERLAERAENDLLSWFDVEILLERNPSMMPAEATFISACSPSVIRALVAAARRGAADRKLLDDVLDDALTAMRDPMTLEDAYRARQSLTHLHVQRKKAAVLVARTPPPAEATPNA